MNLSKNFTLEEMSKSEAALRKGINNTPGLKEIENLKLLCVNILQPLRDWYGKSITVTSGFRSKKTNEAIRGSSSSQHCVGEAVDFIVPREDMLRVFNYIRENLPFDQLIWEFGDAVAPSWIHVSFSKVKKRKQVLRAKKGTFKTIYEAI